MGLNGSTSTHVFKGLWAPNTKKNTGLRLLVWRGFIMTVHTINSLGHCIDDKIVDRYIMKYCCF